MRLKLLGGRKKGGGGKKGVRRSLGTEVEDGEPGGVFEEDAGNPND